MTKLKEYEEYHGYYDGFYMQRVKNGTNITNDDDWYLIANLIQDIRLINKERASKEFSGILLKRLKENCDSEETASQLRKFADKEW